MTPAPGITVPHHMSAAVKAIVIMSMVIDYNNMALMPVE